MKVEELRKTDLLYQDIESRIDSIKEKKNKYIILYRLTKVFFIIAGASITIVTGWKIAEGCDISECGFNPDNYILIISAFLTVLAAIEGLFNFKDKGKSYDIFLFDLRRLRDRISFDYMKGSDTYEKNKDSHFESFQTILQSQKSIIENSDSGEE